MMIMVFKLQIVFCMLRSSRDVKWLSEIYNPARNERDLEDNLCEIFFALWIEKWKLVSHVQIMKQLPIMMKCR